MLEDLKVESIEPSWHPSAHQGAVSSIDCYRNSPTPELLSVGLDGRICITPLDAEPSNSSAAPAFFDGKGSRSFRAGRWAGVDSFVTAGTTGGIELWDRRKGGAPVGRSDRTWGHTGCRSMDAGVSGPFRQITCLDVHPSRPNLCASGSSQGTVSVWDLRFTRAPVSFALPEEDTAVGGEVWECRFDWLQGPGAMRANQGAARVLYCTDGEWIGFRARVGPSSRLRRASVDAKRCAQPWPGGALASCFLDSREEGAGAALERRSEYVRPKDFPLGLGSVNALDLGHNSEDMLVVTDQECLTYIRRRVF